MARLLNRSIVIVCLLGLLLVSAEPAWSYVNNGWDTLNVYGTLIKRPIGQSGRLKQVSELTGDELTDVCSNGTLYYGMTFVTTGCNDARLFVCKVDSFEDPNTLATINDILIAEINPTCTRLAQTMLFRDLVGTQLAEGVVPDCDNIRYCSSRNSLFLGVNEDIALETPAKVYEIDLGLTTILNTFTGPNVLDDQVNVAVTPAGMLYVNARNLDSPRPADPATEPVYGDVILFDTSGGSTSTYTTVIDSDANGGYPGWDRPDAIAYRGTNNPSGRPTLVVLFANNDGYSHPALEFYLDATDGDGNAVLRGSPITRARLNNGQLDEITGRLWLAGSGGDGGIDRGMHWIDKNDKTGFWAGGGNYFKFYDIGSPGIMVPGDPCPVPPKFDDFTTNVPLGSAFVGTEYTLQLNLIEGAAPITWSLPAGPTGASVDQAGLISGWTPTADDLGSTVTFTATATNAFGSPSLTWSVKVFDPGVLVNGFRTDWVYMASVLLAQTLGKDGVSSAFWKDTGEYAVVKWADPGSDWYSLTFSGAGDNDARLFAIQPYPKWFSGAPGVTDLIIAELDANANVIKQAKLGNLAGVGAGNVGPHIMPHNIRYSSYHNSLFIGMNVDETSTTSNPLKVYEVNLGLTAVLNTYTGPNVGGRGVGLDIDARNGTLYVTNWDLNSATPDSGKGDLIAFDTSGGSTSTYATLIDGDTLADDHWSEPVSVVYRGSNNTDRRPTILVLMQAGDGTEPTPQLEFYLDETDPGTGNLVKRGEPVSLPEGWNGQLDIVTGAVALVGVDKGGMQGLLPNDVHYYPVDVGRNWLDADVPPGFSFCNHVIFADSDRDGDVDQIDFSLLQRCMTGEIGADIPSSPEYCWCFDRDLDDDIDQFDITAFVDCATGPEVPFDPGNPPVACRP